MIPIDFLCFSWRKLLVAALAVAVSVAPEAEAAKKKKQPARDIRSVRTEQTATQKAIKETASRLEANTKETRRQLAQYNTLIAEIEGKQKEISALQRKADILRSGIRKKEDSIAANERTLALLRDSYIAVLRRVQESPASLTTLAFIFSSESFDEAWRRTRYLNQFGRWRNMKAGEISAATEELSRRKASLASVHDRYQAMLGQVSVARKELEVKKQQTDDVVRNLKAEEGSLRTVLKENEEKARRLDKELDRLIAEEQARQEKEERQRRAAGQKAAREKAARDKAAREERARKNTPSSQPASPGTSSAAKETPSSGGATGGSSGPSESAARKKLTGSFESNRGRLPFPVAGKYRIVRGFGVQNHPELSHIQTDNSGIDIEVSPSTTVRAVFDGTVSAIFVQPGYNTIVMLRHGSYISIYAGLTDVSVRKGDKVSTGQNIGKVSADVDNDNRAILHFEIRKERKRLNPLNWVR